MRSATDQFELDHLSAFAPEPHLDGGLVSRPFVKAVGHLVRGHVQVQADRRVRVTRILHPMQRLRIWAQEKTSYT